MVVPAVDTRAEYDAVAAVYLPIALAVFVLFGGAIVFVAWRGHRRASAPAGPDERPAVEGVYIAVLAAIVALLVAVTFTAQAHIESTRKPPPLDVSVIAAKWSWTFRYPAYGIEIRTVAGGRPAPPTLVVPAGREVRFRATALDVLHGFWIPERRFQRQMSPGRVTTFRLTFPHPGFTTNATCSFYCGLGHADMRFYVRVLPSRDFDAWVRSRGSKGP